MIVYIICLFFLILTLFSLVCLLVELVKIRLNDQPGTKKSKGDKEC